MRKPELLLPVGNTEAFYAAQEGGADAIYLGLRSFNARGRAKNFAPNQFQSILKEAKQSNIKVYLTLNTLIKNSELPELLDTLFMISQTSVSAVIIQDLGVYYYLSKFFPKLVLHASTQMGFHNSLGAAFAHKRKFERIILARELTWPELKSISQKSKIELEIFTHGALCYSFSGMCLFSSYLGGMSANRGLCRQPCRRIFNSKEKADYFFSLKDNQLIRKVPELMKLNIASIKIEGRMKAAEYVHRVAKAYRMAIDFPKQIDEAEQLLSMDLGRSKTSYFLGGNVQEAITDDPFTGMLIGSITSSSKDSISLKSTFALSDGNRIRIQPADGRDSKAVKLKETNLNHKGNNEFVISIDDHDFKPEDKVFLAGLGDHKFKSKFSLDGKRLKLNMPASKKQNILQKTGSSKALKFQQIFIRIDSPAWLRKIYFDKFDILILKFNKQDLADFNFKNAFLHKFTKNIIVEFPKFISEHDIEFYREMSQKFLRIGISHFMIAHISQKELFPDNPRISLSSNEYVYTMNDAAIQFLHEEHIKFHVYPLENDYPNLLAGKDRRGVVPLYFHPELFYSRMPVDIPQQTDISDDTNEYHRIVKDGMTIVVPKIPVSLLQYRDKLYQNGFRRFLLDLSYEKPSQNTFNRLVKKFHASVAEQPSSTFNFKKNLT